jgi:hypothetical protein
VDGTRKKGGFTRKKGGFTRKKGELGHDNRRKPLIFNQFFRHQALINKRKTIKNSVAYG